MTYLDLFSGIGGFALGLREAGFEFSKHYFSEVDKYASECYQKQFPTAVPLGDIRGIDTNKLGHIDIVTFGFPCQDLSIMGKRRGLEGKRSGLFYEALRIIRICKPKIFIFENVKGLLQSNAGRDFAIILNEIGALGIYECQWQLLNTSWFLPQNRERIYFVGFLGRGSIGQIFPLTNYGKQIDKLQEQTVQTITASYGNSRTNGTYVIKNNLYEKTKRNSIGARIYGIDKPSITLNSMGGGLGANTGLYEIEGRVRRLTPLECERLQGFPDNWTAEFSDTQKYKMLGNAVSVPVVRAVGENILRFLERK
ncbi:MAG: DNA cytosine methyltransferase [Campylobacteraceae bacterium]|nr:DNA cytosine methyltransferase [Campylobacteraceae bacterium]